MLNIFSNKSVDKNAGSVVANYNGGEAYSVDQVLFLQENMRSLRKYIHRTRDLDDAFSIMKSGLVVEGSLEACVDDVGLTHKQINNSNVFNYRFGNYSLIIGLPRENIHIDDYLVSPDSLVSSENYSLIEDVIEECDFENPKILLSKYIAGIADQNTGEIIRNPNYSSNVSNEPTITKFSEDLVIRSTDYSGNFLDSKEAS